MLTNARCLTEGVDVPTLDGVAFIDPRRSQVDIVQAVGRAIRKADDKTVGTIVIPVFVDESSDPEEALDASEFEPVWEVVKALRDHDDVLAEELDELRREQGRRKGQADDRRRSSRPARRVGKVSPTRSTRVLVDRTTASWEEGIGAAEQFRALEGHLLVPWPTVTEARFPLGAWVSARRSDRARGRLSPGRIAQLDALGMVWDAHEEKWLTGLAAARSTSARTVIFVSLEASSWQTAFVLAMIAERRSEHRRGILLPHRVAELDAVSMVWEATDADTGIARGAAVRTSERKSQRPL